MRPQHRGGPGATSVALLVGNPDAGFPEARHGRVASKATAVATSHIERRGVADAERNARARRAGRVRSVRVRTRRASGHGRRPGTRPEGGIGTSAWRCASSWHRAGYPQCRRTEVAEWSVDIGYVPDRGHAGLTGVPRDLIHRNRAALNRSIGLSLLPAGAEPMPSDVTMPLVCGRDRNPHGPRRRCIAAAWWRGDKSMLAIFRLDGRAIEPEPPEASSPRADPPASLLSHCPHDHDRNGSTSCITLDRAEVRRHNRRNFILIRLMGRGARTRTALDSISVVG